LRYQRGIDSPHMTASGHFDFLSITDFYKWMGTEFGDSDRQYTAQRYVASHKQANKP
jgi:hypothetical protein